VFTGHLDRAWREREAAAAERGSNLLGIESPDAPVAEEFLDTFWREFDCFGRGRGQLDKSPNSRFISGLGKLQHRRVIALELLA
jgi:hypothetical protein